MRRGSHRAGRCDKIRTTETRNANNSADRTNLKNLSKDLLQDSQRRRQHVGPPEKELHAVTARCRSHHKIARRIAKQGKARINSAGKAAQINLNRLKPLHPPGHHRPTVLVFSLHASEANATAVSRMRPSDLAKAAEIRSPLTCSESRPKPQQRHLRTCSSVVRAGKTAVKRQGAVRRQSAESPMFNSSVSALSKALKVRSPAARQASSNKRAVKARRAVRRELRASPREIRVVPKAKVKATLKVAKGRARRAAANKRWPCGIAVLDFVPETRILCGYEKTFPRSRLLGLHFSFGVCRRLLFR
jgi:hypothetical protein